MELAEVYEDMRMMVADVCCLQEVRSRGQISRMLGMDGMRYIL